MKKGPALVMKCLEVVKDPIHLKKQPLPGFLQTGLRLIFYFRKLQDSL